MTADQCAAKHGLLWCAQARKSDGARGTNGSDGSLQAMCNHDLSLTCGRPQAASPRVHGTARTGAIAYVTVCDDAPPAAVSDPAVSWTPDHRKDRQSITPPAPRDDETTGQPQGRSISANNAATEGVQKGGASNVETDDVRVARSSELGFGATRERRNRPAVVQLAADATVAAAAAATYMLLPGHAALNSAGVPPFIADVKSPAAPSLITPGRARKVTRSGSLRLTSTPSTAQVLRCAKLPTQMTQGRPDPQGSASGRLAAVPGSRAYGHRLQVSTSIQLHLPSHSRGFLKSLPDHCHMHMLR